MDGGELGGHPIRDGDPTMHSKQVQKVGCLYIREEHSMMHLLILLQFDSLPCLDEDDISPIGGLP